MIEMFRFFGSEYEKSAIKISILSIAVNLTLSAFKLFCGIFGHSEAMISDSAHSLSDVFSTFIVIIGIRLASKKSDVDHRYGHERLECVAAVFLSVLLGLAGLGIGFSGIRSILGERTYTAPSVIAAAAAVVSVVVKEIMYHFTKRTAKKIGSDALMADAWHHRSDALSSVGSFAGIMGARLGFPAADPLAGVIICAFILHSAFEIFKDAADKMVDKSCDEETESKMALTALGTEGVMSLDMLKTRLFGSRIYVDIEISADKDLSLLKAHAIAQNVHDRIESEFPLVKHCMIHVNPR